MNNFKDFIVGGSRIRWFQHHDCPVGHDAETAACASDVLRPCE